MHSLITLFLLFAAITAPLFGQESNSTPESHTLPLVHEYADFLKATKEVITAQDLYDPAMSDQITQVIAADDIDYVVASDQEDQPMHHLTEADLTCYNSWKDASSHLQRTLSPLMMFGRETPQEQEKQSEQAKEKAEQQEEAGRRLSELGENVSTSSSLALRGTLNSGGPKENLTTEKNSSKPSIPKTSSLVTLLKASAVAALLRLSNSFLPVAAAEVVRNSHQENITTWNPPSLTSKTELSPIATHLESSAKVPEIGYLDRTFFPMVTSTCLLFENRTSLISNLFPHLFDRCNHLEQMCSSRHPLVNWLQCDQLPNSEFYQRLDLLKKEGDSFIHSQEATNPDFVDLDVLKLDELLTRWKALIQECQEKMMRAPSLFAQKAWKIELENEEQHHMNTQAEILRLKAVKSYAALTVAESNLKASLPKSLDAVDHQTQIASYHKALSACTKTEKAYQDFVDHLTTHRNSTPKESRSHWDRLARHTQETIPGIRIQALRYQREILIHEATVAEKKAWFNPEKTKKITDKTIATLTKNWDQVIQKFREVNETSQALMQEFFKKEKPSEGVEWFFEERAAVLEHKLLWALATKETQLAAVVQQQKMDELPDMSDTYFDPTVEVPPSMTFVEPPPEYIERVAEKWKKVTDFCREKLEQIERFRHSEKEQVQKTWQQLLTDTEKSQKRLYMDLVIKETAYGSMKKSASDPRIKRREPQEATTASAEDCAAHLKIFDQNAQEKTLPPAWQKFSARQGTICKELPEQAEENAEILRNGLSKWNSWKKDDKVLLLTQSTQIEKNRNQLQSLLAHCTFGCPSTALNATTRSFEKQEKLSQAVTARQAREDSSNELRGMVIDEYQHYTANHTLVEDKIVSLYQKVKEHLKNENLAFKNITSFFTKAQQATIKESIQRARQVAESAFYLSVYYKAMHLLHDVQTETENIDHKKPPIIKIGVDSTKKREPSLLPESNALDKLHQDVEPYVAQHASIIKKTNEIKDLLEKFLEFSEDFSPNEFIKIVADKGDSFVCNAEAGVIQSWLKAQKETFLAKKYKDFASLYPSPENWRRARKAFSTAQQTWQSLDATIANHQANPRIARFRFSLTNLMDRISPEVKKNIAETKAEIKATKKLASSQKKPSESSTSSTQSRATEEAIAMGAM